MHIIFTRVNQAVRLDENTVVFYLGDGDKEIMFHQDIGGKIDIQAIDFPSRRAAVAAWSKLVDRLKLVSSSGPSTKFMTID